MDILTIRSMKESPFLKYWEEVPEEGFVELCFDRGSHKEYVNVPIDLWYKSEMADEKPLLCSR